MNDNSAAEDRAVDTMSAHVREEYGAEVRSEWVRETFRRGLAAYNEVMNTPAEESTSDTEGNSEVAQ